MDKPNSQGWIQRYTGEFVKDFGPSVRINKSTNSPVSKDSQEKKECFFGKDPQVNLEQPLGKLEDELEFKWGRVVTTRVCYTLGSHFWLPEV